MYFQNFLLDLLGNYFDFFTMELFTLSFFHYTHPCQKTYYRYLYLIINLIISAIPVIPHLSIICALLSFFYFCLISSFHFQKSFLFWIKYLVIIESLRFILGLFCAFINFHMYTSNADLSHPFFDYQDIVGHVFTYILLNLYINTKRLRALNIVSAHEVRYFPPHSRDLD